MINVSELKVGNILESIHDIERMGIKAGDHLRVIKAGFSGWDNMPYVDVVTPKGYEMEIMKDYRDFNKLC